MTRAASGEDSRPILTGVLMAAEAEVGGDEFAVLVSRSARQAAVTAGRIVETLSSSFVAGGVEFFSTASIGVAIWPDDSTTKADLLRHADVAMYQAKKAGGNRFELYQPTMADADRDRLVLDAEMRRAIDGDQFFVRYHPRVDLATGRVVAVEALLRWAHPTRGELGPGAG